MNNNENACGLGSCEKNAVESVAVVMENTRNLLEKTIDVGLKIMELLGETPVESPRKVAENIVDSAKMNREEAAIMNGMMERIAETLGC